MATQVDDNKLAEKFSFVLRVLRRCELPKPDWKTITTEEGYSRPDKPREKFRKILKDLGFDYVNDQIIDPNSTGGDAEVKDGTGAGTPAKKLTATAGAKEKNGTAETPNGKKRKSPAKKDAKASPAKKTKVSKCADANGDGEDEAADEGA